MKPTSKFKMEKEVNGRIMKVHRITYDGMFCWVCGNYMKKNGKINPELGTKHHVIPQYLNPINNIIIPVCLKCHRKIHQINPIKKKNAN